MSMDWQVVWEVMKWPFVACLLFPPLLVYLGLHVVKREVIFVDLALAQVAALGATVAFMLGHAIPGMAAYGVYGGEMEIWAFFGLKPRFFCSNNWDYSIYDSLCNSWNQCYSWNNWWNCMVICLTMAISHGLVKDNYSGNCSLDCWNNNRSSDSNWDRTIIRTNFIFNF